MTPNASTQTENDDKVNDRVTGKHGNPEEKKSSIFDNCRHDMVQLTSDSFDCG